MFFLKRLTRNTSNKNTNSDQISNHAFQVNPESVPGKQLDFNFLKVFLI